MKLNFALRRVFPGSSLVFAGILLCSCGQKGPPAGTATNVQSAFKTTPTDIREFADQGVTAESKGEFGVAFVHYRALSLNPELTQEQRDAANQSMLEMGKKLRDAAAKGDTNAEKVLENYRATR